MKVATRRHKEVIVDILCRSFDDNKNINFIVKQDARRQERIYNLMEYSFDVCFENGVIYLTEDERGCMLMLFSENKRNSLRDIFLDLKLGVNCIGLNRAYDVLSKQKEIKKHQPKGDFYYLWYVGVHPEFQGKGIGSTLIRDSLMECDRNHRPVFLTTSMTRNVPLYEKHGFQVYKELDFGYRFYLMIKE